MARIFVLGLDGAAPKLVFEKWRNQLPNLGKMMREGCFARMKSTIPPSTIVAWSAFASGRDAGELDVYSYTHRLSRNSDKRKFTDSTCIKKPLMWDILSKKGLKSNVINVPLTFPAKKINGVMVTDFLTPSMKENCVYPKSFKKTLKKIAGGKDYMFDVGEFTEYKRMPPEKLLQKTREMTEMNFKLIHHLLEKSEWDFFIAEILGTDRLSHLFWHYFDEKHVRFEKKSKLRNALRDYFIYVDKKIGKLRKKLPQDTVFIVASDHGMDRMDGKININDWLIKEGYLSLTKEFAEEAKNGPQKLKLSGIDWKKTRAYHIGSYQGRIYINLKGRGRNGIVPEKDFNKIRGELQRRLAKIRGSDGRKLKTLFFRPEEIYKNGFGWQCPDLIVYFDNLIYGVNDEVGNPSFFTLDTLVGKTSAGHSPEGIFLISGPQIKRKGNLGKISILDAAPTMYKLLGVKAPKDLQGKTINVF